ncbi:hypothetical protein MUK42_30846 [Musa troglodytarum]|uniref:Uncharacterized protein n=1 Tax=Musa troglodytarum TaxID=320322 RepID=A0A9E7GG61_9LILI|nr:hypothetical protein MUK42_30846 [Musa troglodytarum]
MKKNDEEYVVAEKYSGMEIFISQGSALTSLSPSWPLPVLYHLTRLRWHTRMQSKRSESMSKSIASAVMAASAVDGEQVISFGEDLKVFFVGRPYGPLHR